MEVIAILEYEKFLIDYDQIFMSMNKPETK